MDRMIFPLRFSLKPAYYEGISRQDCGKVDICWGYPHFKCRRIFSMAVCRQGSCQLPTSNDLRERTWSMKRSFRMRSFWCLDEGSLVFCHLVHDPSGFGFLRHIHWSTLVSSCPFFLSHKFRVFLTCTATRSLTCWSRFHPSKAGIPDQETRFRCCWRVSRSVSLPG